MPVYQPPCHITDAHCLEDFDCGDKSLDEWLKRRARRNEKGGASRTYVVCEGQKVVAYYALANGSVSLGEAPKKLQRNMPDPIPVMVLGRLAVDRGHQGIGMGRGLLRDAVSRVLQAGKIGGIRAILVHAISQDAYRFYEQNGFLLCPLSPLMLMLPLRPQKNPHRGQGPDHQ